MLVRFFEHGKVKKGAVSRTGGGGDARAYLLFDSKDRTKPRENARLIYGDDVATTEVINGIKNSKIYTSGVLSFAPEESITEGQKIELIESFERNLFPGMTAGEYSGYWVEHLDKDRQELHFVFADIHLPTGRALPVYYQGRDLALVDSWKDLVNHDYDLEDPNDPKRQRAYHLKGYEYALKKQEQQKEKERALKDNPSAVVTPRKFNEEEIGEWLIGEIIDDESIQTQADVVAVIGKVFEITRVAKDGKSISIKNPAGGRNIKLKGMMYERDFSRERFESLGKTQSGKVVERAELVERNQVEVGRRFQRLQQRFKQYYHTLAELNRNVKFEPNQPSPADGGRPYRIGESELGGFGKAVGTDPEGFDESYRAGGPSEGTGRESNSGFETDANRFPNPEQGGDSGVRSGPTATSPSEYGAERETVSDVLSGIGQETGGYASQGVDGGVGDLLVSDATSIGDDGHGILFKTPDEQSKAGIGTSRTGGEDRGAESGNHYDQGSADTAGGSGTQYGDGVTQRPKPIADTDYPQEPASGRLWAESEGANGTGGGSRDGGQQEYTQQPLAQSPLQPLSEQQAEQLVVQPALKQPKQQQSSQFKTAVEIQLEQQGIQDGRSSQPERAYRPKLTDIVERFAQEGGQPFKREQGRATQSNQSGFDRLDTDLIATVIADYQAGSGATKPANAESTGDLLERINKYKSTTVKNADIRQGRVSKLASEDENHVDRVRPAVTARRRRGQKFTEQLAEVDNQLTNPSEQLTELTTIYDQRAGGFGRTHRQLRNAKNRYGKYAHEFKTTTDELEGVIGEICSLIKGVIEWFKKLFEEVKQQALGYAGEGLLYHVNKDGSQGRKATTEETRNYVGSHPYDLSGYAQLRLTVGNWEKQKKEKENTPRFRGFGM